MTIEELKTRARGMLDFGVKRLLESGELLQTFYLVKRDGGMDIISVEGAITNDSNAKTALARKIKERVRGGSIEAVLMVSDVYFASNITPAAEKIRREFRMNVEQANAAGLCEKREAVVVFLESPIIKMHLSQEYRRVEDRIELVGAPIVDSDEDGKMKLAPSRFAGYFAEGGRA